MSDAVLPDSTELAGYLRLLAVPGVGTATANQLIDRLGSAATPFELGRRELAELVSGFRGVRPPLAERIRAGFDTPPSLEPWRSTADEQLIRAEEANAGIVLWGDPRYPGWVARQPNVAPTVLFYRGSLEMPSHKIAAVVGTRKPSAEAAEKIRLASESLASRGWCIASGLALGVDTIAHEVALGAARSTVAVLGNGVDVVYPSENRELLERILVGGVVISEFLLGTRPSAENLRKRNRLTVGCSDVVLIGEASPTSGTLNAARAAREQSKPVYVLLPPPGEEERNAGGLRLVATRRAELVLPARPLEPEQTSSDFFARLRLGRGNPSDDVLAIGKAWEIDEGTATKIAEAIASQELIERLSLRGTKAVLFDLDGVLLDARPALQTAAQLVGLSPQMPFDRPPAQWIYDEYPDNAPALKQRFMNAFERTYGEHAKPFPAATQLLSELKDAGLRTALVTSQPRRRAQSVIDRHELGPFDALVTWNDAPRPKPAPDPLLEALRRLAAGAADEAVFVGDLAEDVRAAHAASMRAAVAGWLTEEVSTRTLAAGRFAWLATPEDLSGMLA